METDEMVEERDLGCRNKEVMKQICAGCRIFCRKNKEFDVIRWTCINV